MTANARCEFCNNEVTILRLAGIQVVEANGHHICKNCAKKLKDNLALDKEPKAG